LITAIHTDGLEWPFVDAHGGWLIFKTGPSELGVHPTSGAVQHTRSLGVVPTRALLSRPTFEPAEVPPFDGRRNRLRHEIVERHAAAW